MATVRLTREGRYEVVKANGEHVATFQTSWEARDFASRYNAAPVGSVVCAGVCYTVTA